MERWPNFFIVGAPKCGTTSLYEYLKQTPGIYMSPVKEPKFFSSVDPVYLSPTPIRDKKKYLALFKKVKNEIAIGEASTTYLRDPQAAKLIHDTVPKARIIVMLRDPVERSFSSYLFREALGWETPPLRDAIKKALNSQDYDSRRIVDTSLYSQQVKRYLDTFGKNLVKIIIFEEFVKDVRRVVKDVLEFLEVNTEPPESIGEVHNPFAVPRGPFATFILRSVWSYSSHSRSYNKKSRFMLKIRNNLVPHAMGSFVIRNVLQKKGTKPELSQEDRIFFEEIYRNDVKKLREILGRPIPWSLVKNLKENQV